jgi:hypothetical protein
LSLVGVVVLALVCTACPKVSESQLDKVAKSSRVVATRYVQVVDFVDALYTSKVIDLATKDRIADGLIKFGENGKKFNGLIATLSSQYQGGSVPPNVWRTISENFDALSKDFLAIVSLIPQASGLSSNTAFRAISAAILALATTLSGVGISVPELERLKEGVSRYGLV